MLFLTTSYLMLHTNMILNTTYAMNLLQKLQLTNIYRTH